MENKELTDAQLGILVGFLQKHNFDKAELSNLILEEFKIEKPIKDMEQLVKILNQSCNIDKLISQIANKLKMKYDKAISHGQAEAILRRVLDIKLDSTGRSQLYELRKKIQKYKNFITQFEEWGKLDEEVIKLIILGSNEGQKHDLIEKISEKKESLSFSHIGVNFSVRHVFLENKNIKLVLWNISGQNEFKGTRKTMYQDSSVVIFTFDNNDPKSPESVKNLYTELKKATNLKWREKGRKNGRVLDMSLAFVGIGSKENKSKEIETLANELDVTYYEMKETENQKFAELLSYLTKITLDHLQ